MKHLLAIGLLSIPASATHAGVIEQEQNFMFALSPGGTALTFPQFDDSGGTLVLEQVELRLDAAISADATVENEGPVPLPGVEITLSGHIEASAGALAAFTDLTVSASSGPLPASDGIPGQGPDFFDFGQISASGIDQEIETFALDAFVGGGLVDVTVSGAGMFTVAGGLADANVEIDNFTASGSVTLTYVFSVIPTPASASVLMLPVLALIRRER